MSGYVICHGSADSGATHVPAALQGNIKQLAVTNNGTCVITDTEGLVVCWGSAIASPPDGATCSGKATEVFMWTTHEDGLAHAAALCNDASLVQWDGTGVTSTPFTGVQHVHASPTDLVVTFQNGTTTFSSGYTGATSFDGNVSRAWTSDAGNGACVELDSFPNSVTCVGSMSSFTNFFNRSSKTIKSAALSWPVSCVQWDDGYQCSSTVHGGSQALAQIWPMVADEKTTGSVQMDTLSVFVEPDATGDFPFGVLCGVAGQVKCQGTGFSGAAGDITDGVYALNTEDTTNATHVVVTATHACARVVTKTVLWAWIVFGTFVVFFFVAIYLSYRHSKHIHGLEQFRVPLPLKAKLV